MTDEKENSNVNNSSDAGLRDHLVNTAVNFLLNPGVQKRVDQSKIQFLRKKGLTEPEIAAAFEKAKLDSKFIHSFDTSPQVNEIYPDPLASHYVVPSIWSRLSDFTSPIIILGVALYGLHHFYQKYLKPWLLGKDASDSLADHMKALTDNIAVLTDTVSKLNISVAKQNEDINRLLQLEGSSYAPTPVILEDLKREVNSLKSILISRHQFPATPQLHSIKPTIPSWQLPDLTASTKSEISSDSQEQETKDTLDDENSHKENILLHTQGKVNMVDGAASEADEEVNTATTIQVLNSDSTNGILKLENSCVQKKSGKKLNDTSSSSNERIVSANSSNQA